MEKDSTGFRIGVRFRLMLGLSLVTAAALAGGAFSIFGLDRLHRGFEVFTTTQLPALTNASTLARQSESIIASAPTLVVSRDQFSRTTAEDRVADQVRFLDELLAKVNKDEAGQATIGILEDTKQNLLDNLRRINEMVERRIDLDGRTERIIREILALAIRKVALVNQMPLDLSAGAAAPDLAAWNGEMEITLGSMLAAYGVQRSIEVSSYRRQATEAIERADKLIGRFPPNIANEAALRRLHEDIRDRTLGPVSVFSARNEVLGLQQSVGGMLARNKVISDQFGAAVSGMFDTILQDLQAETRNYADLISTYRQVLIAAVLVAIAFSLVAFAYISRRVIRRIVALRDSMLAHAAGISAPVEIDDPDEIGDMGRAIQFFVTAIQRREEALTVAKNEAETALAKLRRAQQSLIQSEKLASLGQLTAGIAHEIKNPLNFVNNFSSLSGELIDELREVLRSTPLGGKAREEVQELTEMLKGNLEKVVEHGKRADSIVKNMLLHSRQGSGERRSVDLNALVEQSINLAYHGARAEKPGFNITLEKDLDPAVGEADLFPQEITRVLLNLISNGFYAAAKRKRECADGSFTPTLMAATRNRGDTIEIRIRDNGTGIADDVRGKLFNPFFTTKPAGEGTGLGLSLSHDIVVKQHGGAIKVDTKAGEFTEFTIVLPRAAPAPPAPISGAIAQVPGAAS